MLLLLSPDELHHRSPSSLANDQSLAISTIVDRVDLFVVKNRIKSGGAELTHDEDRR